MRRSMKKKRHRLPNVQTVNQYPSHLRGLANNRWGGHQNLRLRGFPETGTSGPGKRLSAEEIKALEPELRARRLID